MRRSMHRIGRDVRERRHLDAYVVALTACGIAIVSAVADVVPQQIQWSAMLAGIGLLVFRITLPTATDASPEELLQDRRAFDTMPLSERLRDARTVWIFAPSGVGLLSPATCQLLRTTVLSRPDGVVRVIVMDPHETAGMAVASRQLDDSTDFPLERLPESLARVTAQLRLMSAWTTDGTFEFRRLGFNPGFSMLAIDAGTPSGTVIVEMHGFHNESIDSRPHMELKRTANDRWYRYWADQFLRMWEAADPATTP
ncbi:hypothetical protein [Streptomyces genisteinicus]|uniref:Uncharacterized protein n=1 Tax=Streptomyces genisteinicus TaxID=2768068 RepID=A0A7H0I0P3_9ACTN|nr:hypothetical protein [Streptomyces genisteinicus]QNP66359.1 hypothetical protein IAG43_27805 [Streptomyces genisteinicus]